MLIQETKMNQQQIQDILKKSKSKFEVMAQDTEGTAGGLAILWNPKEVIFENWISLSRILSGVCRIAGTRERVLISGVYGPHLPRGRKEFMRNIQAIRKIIPDDLWIVGGDFNLIRDLGGKRGGIRRQDPRMDDFNELITNLRLVDIPTSNGVFTWNNRRGGRNQIASKLDRFLLAEQVLNRDVFIEAKILPGLGSDHWPICLEIDIKKIKSKKPFHFESFWLRNPDFLSKIEEWWTQSQARGQCKMHSFQLRLKEMKNRIRKWNKEVFGNIFEDKQNLEKAMEEVQQKIILEGRDEERSNEEGRIISQLEERRKQEEILWKQKSRINSLREGERVIEQDGIEKVLFDYHKGILSESLDERGEAIKQICKEIPKMVTDEQNKGLMRVATLAEVEEVIMNMKRGKSPRPDGFTVEFYQAAWKFMGQDILEFVEESRLKYRMWSGINSTFLTLIPKNNNTEEAQGFRPIALCNVIYKVISSLVAKRLKPLLPSIISPEKTGFVEGRKILDGLVVAQEVIHSLNQNKRKGMMIKLDLSKAYDRLNWRYLSAVLEAYGFEKRWIEWILSMVSTPIFSILVNGLPTKTFNASRGIRLLNIASRLVLLKSVLQSIPVYTLSIRAASKGVCEKLREIFGKFVCSGPTQQRKWALVSWANLIQRKEEGGLGVRDPEILNKVLGAKLWWRWLQGGTGVWKKIWEYKYSMPE
eukprot:PITA_35212